MSKTHYQAFYVDKKESNRAICNDYYDNPVTTEDFSEVDCKRCIVIGKMYSERGAYDKSLVRSVTDAVFIFYMMARHRWKSMW